MFINRSQFMGFDFTLPEASLKAALLVSLLSVWVLVGLFHYLNRYTKRSYFTIWTAAWLFYALFLTISISLLSVRPNPMLVMCKNWCVATAAVLMLWGSFRFMRLRTAQRLIVGSLSFVTIWSYAASFQYPNELWIQIPAFSLLAFASGFTAYCFFFFRERRPYLGAGLLTFGFSLWALYLVLYPFLQSPEHLLSMAFLISGVLQLFIAVSMIILVLEEVRAGRNLAERRFLKQRDQTDYFRANAAMHQKRYQQLFENASDAIVIATIDELRVLELNHAARTLFRTPERFADVPLSRYCQPEGSAGIDSPQTWLKHLVESVECDITRHDGSRIRAHVRGGEIPYGDAKAYLIFFSELTQRAKLEQQLRQAEKLSALGQMISGVAHELNNPLAAIKGFVDLILFSHELQPATRTALVKVSKESNRAAKLVTNFLSFAQPESPKFETIDLNQVVREVVESRADKLKARSVTLTSHLAATESAIRGNITELEQVLVNLIMNSVQAVSNRPGGEVRVSTRSHEGRIQFRVEDNGPGIPDDVLPHIFEPFFTTKHGAGGTGLGLSICYSIVLTHGGRIYYEPRQSRGACFTVELPLVANAEVPSGPSAEVIPVRTLPEPVENSRRVLIVDDESAIADLLKEMLLMLGYEAHNFHDPALALKAIQAERFDLIISDFRMPGMTGEQLYRQAIAADPRLQGHFLFLTGDLVNEETKAFFTKTKLPYSLKPFQLSTIESAIERIFAAENGQIAA